MPPWCAQTVCAGDTKAVGNIPLKIAKSRKTKIGGGPGEGSLAAIG